MSSSDVGRLVSGLSSNSVVVQNIHTRALEEGPFTAHPILLLRSDLD